MASDEREIRTVHSIWIDAVNYRPAKANCQSREGSKSELEAQCAASFIRQLSDGANKERGRSSVGNGQLPKVVKDHYFEIVDEDEAKEYWSIKPLPKGDRKIVAIA